MTTVGLDIGGTKILGALVEEDGTIRARGRRDTPAGNPSAIIAGAADLIQELAAQDPSVEAAGVACAGFLDRDRTTVVFAPNVAWRDEAVKAELERMTGKRVILENDANAATWGEFVHGSAGHVDDLMFLTIGTGVGGGVVIDGRLLRGAFGMGGELGHMRVVPDGHLCGCGIRGCLEQYASGSALVREARALVASGAPGATELKNRCDGDPDALTGQHVTEAAVDGDAAAIGLLAELGRWIGEGAGSLAAILDPEVILIGGGVSQAGALLLDPAKEAFAAHITGKSFRPRAELKIADLRDDAGVVGAAALARGAAQ